MSDALAGRIKWWLVAISMIGMAGFGISEYLGRYARAEDLDELDKNFHQHVENSTSRMSAFETQSKHLEDDFHWQREQLQHIADRVGAVRVETPQH